MQGAKGANHVSGTIRHPLNAPMSWSADSQTALSEAFFNPSTPNSASWDAGRTKQRNE